MATTVARLSSNGVYFTNTYFDEIAYTNNKISTTAMYSGGFDEVAIKGGSVAKRETSDGRVLVSGYFDEITGIANVITSGLILFLDAGNPASYPDAGSTWTDLSIYGNSATLVNSPTFSTTNGGIINLNGSNQYTVSNNLVSQLGASSSISEFIWVRPTAQGQIVVELGSTTPSSGWHDSNIEINSSGAISMSIWQGSLNNRVTTSNLSFNNWYYVGFTYDGATLTGYLNGTAIGTTTFSRQVNGSNYYYAIGPADSTNMGTNAYLTGSVAVFQMYNRAIQAGEVSQNFNAQRNRFGI